MKRIKRRAAAAWVLAGLILLGLGLFLFRLGRDGAVWATYSANASVYENGRLRCGVLTDRNGLVLADGRNGERHYAGDPTVRRASLHAVGDFEGYIGSGALTAFARELTGYSWWKGTTGEGGVVRLAIDSQLQKTAWNALDGRKGAVIVLNYETGEVLCMVSSPAYDPEEGADEAVEGVYLNRCLQSAYTPGSVFKLVTLAAAIENIPDLRERSFSCSRYMDVNGVQIVCGGNHGSQTIEEALAHSCNCAFGTLALELGPETLAEYAARLGLSGSLALDGIVTAAGRYDAAPAGSADLAWSGIGQYTDLVTPYAMARLCAAIGAGGELREPTLLKGGDNGRTRLLDADTAAQLSEMMNYTVAGYYGRDRFPGLEVCAKSGTAEVGGGASHAWFAGFLQEGAPLAFAVVLERGGGGLAKAGPVANTVLQKASEIYEP